MARSIERMEEEERDESQRRLFDVVLEDVVRAVNRAFVAALAEQEQEAQVNRARFQATVVEQLRSEAARSAAAAAAAEAQRAQIASSPQHDATDAQLAARADVVLAVQRRGSQVEAIAAMEAEREARIARQHFDRVAEEVRPSLDPAPPAGFLGATRTHDLRYAVTSAA